MNLDALKPLPRSGSEPFHGAGKDLDFDLLSFWRWACSDLCNNLMRGVLAEYIVARAVGTGAGVRCEWGAYDLLTPDGIKVEVKTSAYLQSWNQKKLSAITFDIAPKQGGDAAQGTTPCPPARFADVYVFALLAHTDKVSLDPLDVSQWEFYVLPTRVLNDRCPKQKTLSLASLVKLGPARVGFADLSGSIRASVTSAAMPEPCDAE